MQILARNTIKIAQAFLGQFYPSERSEVSVALVSEEEWKPLAAARLGRQTFSSCILRRNSADVFSLVEVERAFRNHCI